MQFKREDTRLGQLIIVDTAENQGPAAQAAILDRHFRVADIGDVLDLSQKKGQRKSFPASRSKKGMCGSGGLMTVLHGVQSTCSSASSISIKGFFRMRTRLPTLTAGSSPDCTIRYAVVRLMPIRRAACSTDNVIASSLWCSFVMVAPCSFVMIAPYDEKALSYIYMSSPARRGH